MEQTPVQPSPPPGPLEAWDETEGSSLPPLRRGWQPPPLGEITRLLPSYDVLSLLGRGGMGAVYLVMQAALNRPAALKFLPAEISRDPAFARRFIREAQAMALLNHPGIATIYDFGTTGEGHHYFVMEYIDGSSLEELMRGDGLSPEQSLSLVSQVCEALAYAHEHGVLHRDIKPSNVMVDQRGRAKVVDFGLARLSDPAAEAHGATQAGLALGTPGYMAPEQQAGGEVDQRADLYSAGAMLYEMLCRAAPHGVFVPPSEIVACSPAVDRLVLKAMSPVPALRFQNAREMRDALELARVARGGRPWPRLLTAGLLLAALLGLGCWWARRPADPVKAVAIPAPAPVRVATASQGRPFINSLGMRFVPVPIIGGPTGGRRVLFSIWETRVSDYRSFLDATGRAYEAPGFAQGLSDPVVLVTWEEARDFGVWLTARERQSGALAADEEYRLPLDHEWSCAAGLGEMENPLETPVGKSGRFPGQFPWGNIWPPPPGVGNFAGQESIGRGLPLLAGYRDPFRNTGPVGSFAPNSFGLYDLAGNAWELCLETLNPSMPGPHVKRGGGFDAPSAAMLCSSVRRGVDKRKESVGFRLVLAKGALAR